MNFFRQVDDLEWDRLRGLGRRNYIWTQAVRPMGIPAALAVGALRVAEHGGWQYLFSIEGALVMLAYVVVGSLVMSAIGAWSWERNRREPHG
jgi:hypothetical protein